MLKRDYDGNIMLWYSDKKHIAYACEWFWNNFKNNYFNTDKEMFIFIKKMWDYDDEIIEIAYRQFQRGILPHQINFGDL
jgi:hypothetical protein